MKINVSYLNLTLVFSAIFTISDYHRFSGKHCDSFVACTSKSLHVISSITQDVYCVAFAWDYNSPLGK